jgi:UDP-N-acetylmuramoyl-tripeptide--D-alanyl-D-alanine ligase
MIQMNLHQVSAIVGGNFVGKEARIQGVTTDSRGDCQGKLFVALRGEFFNGEDYCQAAVERGAAAVLVANAVEVDVPQLIVKDTLIALQAIATAWVRQTGVKIIAITGSNGKTTVKNMLFSVLSQKYHCFATQGNFNNEIGVPLTLLSISQTDEVAVIEMGAAQIGDIAKLTDIIKPDISLVTNIGDAHVGRFGSVDNIAIGKAEIYQALDADGLAIINADSPYKNDFKAKVKGRVITFGLDAEADFRLVEKTDGYEVLTRRGESIDLQLPVVGLHNYMNATSVVAMALAMHMEVMEIAAGLAAFEPESGRLQWQQVNEDLNIINDSYNANPSSVKAAIDVLRNQTKPSCLILGDMAELGIYAQAMHASVGQYAAEAGIDQLMTVGEFAELVCESCQSTDSQTQCQSFNLVDELMSYLQQNPIKQGTVLVKGSRSMRLERVVDVLTGEKVA